eukprot:7741010-Karenia_brevis.AAC.1
MMRPKYLYKLHMTTMEPKYSYKLHISTEAQVFLQASCLRRQLPCMGVPSSPAQLEVGTLMHSIQAAPSLHARGSLASCMRHIFVCVLFHSCDQHLDVSKVSMHGIDRSIIFIVMCRLSASDQSAVDHPTILC